MINPLAATPVHKAFLAAAAVAAASLLGVVPAQADYLKREIAGGHVQAVESDGAHGHYLGGNFRAWNADSTGGGFSLKDVTFSGDAPTDSGTLDTRFKAFDGGTLEVRSVLDDGAGGWYVGGSFTRYGGATANSIAHIKADGSLDPDFQASIPNIGTTGETWAGVWTLARSGSTLYVGGLFDQVNGSPRTDVAALDATTGALKTGFDANVTRNPSPRPSPEEGPFRGVRTLLVDGSDLFIGGNFAKIGAYDNQGVGKVDAATGASDATFNGAADSVEWPCEDTSCNKPTVAALAKVGSDLWIGGTFLTQSFAADGERRGLMVVSPTTQAVDKTKTTAVGVWNSGGAKTSVSSIVQDGAGHVYIGGAFVVVGTPKYYGYPNSTNNALYREGIAKYDLAAGKYMTSFNVNARGINGPAGCLADGPLSHNVPGGSPEVVGMTLDGSTLYAAGRFSRIGGADRAGVAALDSATGTANSSFNPAPTWFSSPVFGCSTALSQGIPGAITKSASSGALFVGGHFDSVGGTPVGGLIHVKADGTRDAAFSAALVPRPDYAPVASIGRRKSSGVRAIVKVDNKLYVGGYFDNVNNSRSITSLAILDATDGTLAPRQVAGNFVSESVSTDPANSYPRTYTPGINDLKLDGGTLWAAGQFQFEGSSGANSKTVNIVGIDTSTDVKTPFSTYPWTSGRGYSLVNRAPPVEDLVVGANDIYAASADQYCGNKTSGNCGPRDSAVAGSALLAINKTTGAKSTSPLGNGLEMKSCNTAGTYCSPTASVQAIAGYKGKLYLAGVFNRIGTTDSSGFIEVDPETGTIGSFDPDLLPTSMSSNGNRVSSIVFAGDRMILGGSFTSVKGVQRGGIAEIDMTTGSVTGFDPLGGSSFATENYYLDPSDGKLYASGIRSYPSYTDYPTVGVVLDPTLRYSSGPTLKQVSFGYFVTLNLQPPSAPTITSPAAGSTSSTGSVAFTGGDGNTFECQVGSGSWASCSSPLDVSGLPDGSHTVSVRQTDSLGRTSSAASVTWTVDRTPPPAPRITSKPAATTTDVTASIGYAGSGEPAATFECRVDGGAAAACSGNPVQLSGLTVGPHDFEVREVDAAGNRSPAASTSWTVQASPSPCTPRAIPPTPTSTVKLTRIKGGFWVMNAGSVFNTGGDMRGCARILTIQVSVDPVRPLDSLPHPTVISFQNGILAWNGKDVSRNGKQPRWMRVGNRIGRWTGWVAIKY
ncbi:MAG: hypothetical protein WCO96_03780 [Actinomycetes bacterium]